MFVRNCLHCLFIKVRYSWVAHTDINAREWRHASLSRPLSSKWISNPVNIKDSLQIVYINFYVAESEIGCESFPQYIIQ